MRAPFRIDGDHKHGATLWGSDDASVPVIRHIPSAETRAHAETVVPHVPGAVVQLTGTIYARRSGIVGTINYFATSREA